MTDQFDFAGELSAGKPASKRITLKPIYQEQSHALNIRWARKPPIRAVVRQIGARSSFHTETGTKCSIADRLYDGLFVLLLLENPAGELLLDFH